MKHYTRRQIMRAFALGGAMVAGELWVPGRTLISLPSPRLKYKATERFSPGWMERDDELEAAVAKFLLRDAEVLRYKNLWIAASQDGGALLSKDGIHWEGIRGTELYSNGDRVVSVKHKLLADVLSVIEKA